MQINMTKLVPVEAKTIKVHIKVRDEFAAALCDQDGQEIAEYEGYVPSFFPGQHCGDYLILDIDIDTGQITNWKAPTQEQVEEFISKGEPK